MLCLISARRKHPAPNSSGKRGMGSNRDRRDSHGSIHQAHSPSAQSEAGARPTTEWGKCKRDWAAPFLEQPKQGLSKQLRALRREEIYS